jgi:hypothetical protein
VHVVLGAWGKTSRGQEHVYMPKGLKGGLSCHSSHHMYTSYASSCWYPLLNSKRGTTSPLLPAPAHLPVRGVPVHLPHGLSIHTQPRNLAI